MRNPWDWTKDDLEQLVGQAESLRLEFKQSKLFESDPNKIIDNLTKEVSAFANTEGGTIVVGVVEEKRGRTRFATAIDEGLDVTKWSLESIQQMIEANVRPHLTGLRIRAIPLDANGSRCAVSIWVPQGTTAYQARDYLYYGRSEYESKPLPDHDIRLRMLRGKARQAAVVLDRMRSSVHRLSPTEHKDRLIRSLGYTAEELEELADDEIILSRAFHFNVWVENIGEVNLSEFKVRFSLESENIYGQHLHPTELHVKDGWTKEHAFNRQVSTIRVNVFPGDRHWVRNWSFGLRPGQVLEDVELKLVWTLYLRDTFPIEGVIDVIDAFERGPVTSVGESQEAD